jgi:hypothetical protein
MYDKRRVNKAYYTVRGRLDGRIVPGNIVIYEMTVTIVRCGRTGVTIYDRVRWPGSFPQPKLLTPVSTTDDMA